MPRSSNFVPFSGSLLHGNASSIQADDWSDRGTAQGLFRRADVSVVSGDRRRRASSVVRKPMEPRDGMESASSSPVPTHIPEGSAGLRCFACSDRSCCILPLLSIACRRRRLLLPASLWRAPNGMWHERWNGMDTEMAWTQGWHGHSNAMGHSDTRTTRPDEYGLDVRRRLEARCTCSSLRRPRRGPCASRAPSESTASPSNSRRRVHAALLQGLQVVQHRLTAAAA